VSLCLKEGAAAREWRAGFLVVAGDVDAAAAKGSLPSDLAIETVRGGEASLLQ
jgi:hypothetical protein